MMSADFCNEVIKVDLFQRYFKLFTESFPLIATFVECRLSNEDDPSF